MSSTASEQNLKIMSLIGKNNTAKTLDDSPLVVKVNRLSDRVPLRSKKEDPANIMITKLSESFIFAYIFNLL